MTVDDFCRLFSSPKPVIGVVHLLPLPGSPEYEGDVEAIVRRAVSDARSYQEAGFSGIIVENYGDMPFLGDEVGPETVASISVVAQEVTKAVHLPVGINVLRNDARAAMAVAVATGARFVRVNLHVGAMLTDQGIIQGKAAQTLRFRRQLGAPVAVFADVLVKHADALVEIDVEQAALDTVERGLADGLIVTGRFTGSPCNPRDIEKVKGILPSVPVMAGSGVDAAKVTDYLAVADGIIVGTSVKQKSRTLSPVDREKAAELMKVVQEWLNRAEG